MYGHLLRDLDAPAVRQVVRNSSRAERVAAIAVSMAASAARQRTNAPDILARHGRTGEFLGFANGSAKQRPLVVVLDARGFPSSSKANR